MSGLRWCALCRVYWRKRRRRQWCPKCHEILLDRAPAPLPPEIRPGVRAQWDERQARPNKS